MCFIIAIIVIVTIVMWLYNIPESGTLGTKHPIAGYEERLERPDTEYGYHELVGMQYRKLKREDFGCHKGTAVSERNNPYDKYAVAIKNGNGKVVAYVPKSSNYNIWHAINEQGGEVPAVYKIWSHDGEKIYGIAFIREAEVVYE